MANDLTHEVIAKLVEVLKDLPEVRSGEPMWSVRHPDMSGVIDAEVVLDVAGKKRHLLVEVKKTVFPRDVHQLLWQLRQFKKLAPQAIPLLAAESISTGAKEILKKESVGYYDTGGSLFVPGRGSYIYIEKPPPKALAKPVRNLFRGKRSQVLQTLLRQPDKWFGVHQLAQISRVSPATASETLSGLDRFDWLASQGQGPSKERRLINPRALLDEWQKQILSSPRSTTYRRYFVGGSDAEELLRLLSERCNDRHVQYAVTEEAAAQKYAPYLTAISQVACRVKPGEAANRVIADLGARIVNEGSNLNVIETRADGDFLFTETKDSLCLASPIQVYLDLLRKPGRAKELAEHLRQQVIRF